MKIKEVEKLVGLSQSNIRFYEEAGLIKPTRLDNNYRDYSQQDVKILNGIKKLRILGLSIDQIKELYAKNESLEEVLRLRLKEIEEERNNLIELEKLCKSAIESQLSIESIDELAVDEKSNEIERILRKILQSDTYVDEIDQKDFKKIIFGLYTAGTALGILISFLMMKIFSSNSASLNLSGFGISRFGGALDGSAMFFVIAIIPAIVIYILGKGVKNGPAYICLTLVAALNQALMIQGLIGLVDGITKNVFSVSAEMAERMALVSLATIVIFAVGFLIVLILYTLKISSRHGIILASAFGLVALPVVAFVLKSILGQSFDLAILIAVLVISFVFIFATTLIWNLAARTNLNLTAFLAFQSATDMLNVAGVMFDLRGRYGSNNIRRTKEEDEKFYRG